MTLIADSVRQLAAGLMVLALVIAALVLGQAILVPLAGAAIVSFILAPIVRWQVARGIPRGLAVGGVMSVVLAALAGVTLLLSVELISLTAKIGDYRENIIQKVRAVSALGREDGVLRRATRSIDQITDAVGRELAKPGKNEVEPNGVTGPVVVREAQGPTAALAGLAQAVERFAAFGLTVLFTLFLLLQHQDMRDRIVRVIGTDNLSDTTSAMSDAGKRLSRLFLAQAILNGGYGLAVGLVLWAIGLPGALLWGVLAALMRFVPFVGSFIAAAPPVLLAAGVDPGWGLALFVMAMFVATEIAMGNLLEPMFLGSRVGLSPFAMIAAASFWTLVWGPVGLLVAAPLTMALVVLGRYIQGLTFISVLLGDEPALEPDQELYHRLLAGDALAAAEQIEAATTAGIGQAADALVLPALRLAAFDDRNGRLSREQATTVRRTLAEAVAGTTTLGRPAKLRQSAAGGVLVVPARGDIDITSAAFLASCISAETGRVVHASDNASGLTALSAANSGEDGEQLAAIVILTAGGASQRQLRFVATRAARDFDKARVIVLKPVADERSDREVAVEPEGARLVPTVAELLVNLEPELSGATPSGQHLREALDDPGSSGPAATPDQSANESLANARSSVAIRSISA
ncbi:MAG: AI-2E family transporter [Hyphomicrobiaceae bacterium]